MCGEALALINFKRSRWRWARAVWGPDFTDLLCCLWPITAFKQGASKKMSPGFLVVWAFYDARFSAFSKLSLLAFFPIPQAHVCLPSPALSVRGMAGSG